MTRRMICRFLAGALVFFIVLPVFPQSAILVPRETFVGDSAELTFKTRVLLPVVKPGSTVVLSPQDFPVSPDLTVTSIHIISGDKESDVIVNFVPWVAGPLRIPAFSVQKIRVVPPAVRIASLVDKTGQTALEPPRPPLLVPGTTWLLYSGIAGILILAFILVLLFVKLYLYFAGAAGNQQSGRRIRLAQRQLKMLDRLNGKIGTKEWYARYARILRTWLGSFCGGNPDTFRSATVTEIIARLREFPGNGGEVAVDQAGSFFYRIDLIRYSADSVPSVAPEETGNARRLIETMENGLRAYEIASSIRRDDRC
jgi:hypothetical protein